ncbi:hypothetical protein ACFQ60_07125 [Streptomyces zhihengii]
MPKRPSTRSSPPLFFWHSRQASSRIWMWCCRSISGVTSDPADPLWCNK